MRKLPCSVDGLEIYKEIPRTWERLEIGVDILTKMWDPTSLDYMYRYPLIGKAVDELTEQVGGLPVGLMINRLAPGVEIEKHIDKAPHPGIERWHLPLVAPREALYWDEQNGWLHMEPGYWWGPIPFWIPHQVKNMGEMERIHLIVDLSVL